MGRLSGLRVPWPAPGFFATRLLFTAAIAFLAGIVASASVSYAPWGWAAPVALAGGALLLRRRPRAACALLLAAMAALGLLRGAMALRVPVLPPTGRWQVEGTIDGVPNENARATMVFLRQVRVLPDGAPDWVSIDGAMYCYIPVADEAARPALSHGERIGLAGTSYLPTGPRNPGGFDQRMWMAQQGAHVRLYATEEAAVLAPAGWSLKGMALSVSQALGARMDALFGRASPVVRAMLIGDTGAMPDDWYRWMGDSGVAHVLSVSGLHVGLWYLLLDRMLRPLSLSPKARWLSLLALLSLYALLTGLRPSVLRASLMLLASSGGHIAKRKPDPLTGLALSALLLLAVRPLDLFGASFQLSYAAVLGLVLLRPLLTRGLRFLGRAASGALGASLAATLGILPAASRWFGSMSLVSLLLNMIAIPLTGLLIPVAALGVALDALWPPLGALPVEAAKGMVAALLMVSRAAASLPGALIPVAAFAWWTAAAFLLGIVLCSSAAVWRWRRRLLCMGLSALAALGIGYARGDFLPRYVQLDVGQALSGVLTVGGHTYVYDCGNQGSDLRGYLYHTGSRITGVFISHPHADHMGGLWDLLEAGMPIGALYVPANADAFGADDGYRERILWAEQQGVPIVALAAGDVLALPGVTVTVLAPQRDVLRGNSPNDRSLVLEMAVQGHRILLTGDADGVAEPGGIPADVLQVAHHGSRAAAGEAFLARVQPEIALVSVGRNGYGHPNPETLSRLEDAGASVYCTLDTGAVTLRMTRDEIRVEAYLR